MNPSIRVIHADVLDGLKQLADGSVHCVITSPPYFGLRDYEEKGQIGLEETPEEYVAKLVAVFREVWRVLRKDGVVWLNIGDSYATNGVYIETYKKNHPEHRDLHVKHSERYVNKKGYRDEIIKAKDLMGIPWRVAFALQADGWWLRSDIIWSKPNPMPESVTSRPTKSHEYIFLLAKSGSPVYWVHRDGKGTRTKPAPDYRYIDLINEIEYLLEPPGFDIREKVPCPLCSGSGMVVEQGWFGEIENLCEDCNGKSIVSRWKRVNLWSGRDYFYDNIAIQEPVAESSIERSQYSLNANNSGFARDSRTGSSYKKCAEGATMGEAGFVNPAGRNRRTVWEIATQSYKGAHFAVFPEALIEPCIKAGTSERGCCPKCGAPWERVVKKEITGELKADGSFKVSKGGKKRANTPAQQTSETSCFRTGVWTSSATLGWHPTCTCHYNLLPPIEPVPCIVLDPFAGSGTTMRVSRAFKRSSIGIELSAKYVKMIRKDLKLDNQLKVN